MKHRSETNKKPRRHHALARAAGIFLLVLVVAIVAMGTFVIATFDPNAHRDLIARTLSGKSGRTIALNGSIDWAFSVQEGLSLEVNDMSVGNPSWASRPRMASIGSAALRVAFLPLLGNHLEVVSIAIERADILLETKADGANNWSLPSDKASADANPSLKTNTAATAPKIDINVKSLVLTQSRLGIKGANGKTSLYEIPEMTMSDGIRGLNVRYKGVINGTDAAFSLAGKGMRTLMDGSRWPFNLKASLGPLRVDARGALEDHMKTLRIEDSLLTSGKTKMAARGSVALSGARPIVRATIASPFIDPNDLSFGGKEAEHPSAIHASPTAQRGAARVFSAEPLALEGIGALDGHVDLKADVVALGLTSLRDVAGTVRVENGRLVIDPFKAFLAGSPLSVFVSLDASRAQNLLDLRLKAPEIDLSQLIEVGGSRSFISGKSALSADIRSSGHSLHDFASYADGTVSLTMIGGQLSSSSMKSIAGSLVDFFAPGVGSLLQTGVNCLAARYAIKNGLMETKGFLLDTDMTTIAGSGYINLADERVNLAFRTKPKGVQLGSLLPPMSVGGSLASPLFSMDATSTVRKVADMLLRDQGTDDGVPTLLKVPEGENACLATLNNPAAAKAAAQRTGNKPLVRDQVDAITDGLKDLGGDLVKGLFGH